MMTASTSHLGGAQERDFLRSVHRARESPRFGRRVASSVWKGGEGPLGETGMEGRGGFIRVCQRGPLAPRMQAVQGEGLCQPLLGD